MKRMGRLVPGISPIRPIGTYASSRYFAADRGAFKRALVMRLADAAMLDEVLFQATDLFCPEDSLAW